MQVVEKECVKENVIYRNGIPEQIVCELTSGQRRQYFVWDELLKRMAGMYPELLIPVVNEIFGKNYAANARIEFLSTEYSVDTLGREKENVIRSIFADIVFRIDGADIYHMECQIVPQAEMVVRMYEYDTQIAKVHGMKNSPDEKRYLMEMPRSAVLYLTHTKNTPEKQVLELTFSNGERCEYEVPVMKVQNYSLEKIREKRLYLLMPLAIVRFHSKMKNKERDFGEKTLTDFLRKSIIIISEAIRKEYLSEKEGKDIIDFLDRACRYLFSENEEALKEVRAVMEPFFKLGREIFEEEVTERVTREVTERVTQDVTERVTQDVTEQVTQQVTLQGSRALIVAEKEEGKSKEDIVRKLQRIFGVSEDEAKENVELYYE